MIIDDLGLTILRMEYLPTDEFPTHFMNNQAPFLQAIKAKADGSGEPLKVIATYWSPPAWMKDNASTINGGSVLPEYYDDLGDYSVQTIQDYNSIGIDLYALSIQNEPAFVEPYRSCVYTREQYRDMIKVAGPIIHAAFPDVKLFGAEDVLWPQEYPATCFEQALIDDSPAFAQMGIWALHGYGGDGSLPDPSSAQAEIWNYAKNRFEPTGKHCWMTETSGYWDDWPDCMNLAQSMYASLKFGHISAAVWWRLDVDASYWFDETLIYQGSPTRRYYISKHYYRYIRPDAVMVQSASDNSNLLVVAFKHPQQRTSTIVLINASELDKTVELNINGDILPNEYNVHRTTATEDCILAGTAMHNGSVFVPASSVVTLYGTDLCPDCDHVPDGIINMCDLAELGSQWGDEPVPPPFVDVAPSGGDGAVDILDLMELSRCWLKEVGSSQ
jgi:O-glycosyl hydrolase